MNATPSGRISGKTLRFTWTDGPTKGESHEHVFHEDGSVEFRKADGGGNFTREQRYGSGASPTSRRPATRSRSRSISATARSSASPPTTSSGFPSGERSEKWCQARNILG
jgi:hypothetical protein